MENRELPFVREMFDNIAPHYDLLNRILSVRQDVVWRKKMVAAITLPENGRVLDVACGTGDVVIEVRRQKGPGVTVVGIDFSPGMLDLARRKISCCQTHAAISLLVGNALAMPFRSASFHALTIAFGIRNIQDKAGVLKSFYDTLVPGGMVLILELATPQKTRLRKAYLAYFQKALPLIGRLFSKHSYAYSYLPESVSRFPDANGFMSIMRTAGFTKVNCRRLTFGVANLFVGVKPG